MKEEDETKCKRFQRTRRDLESLFALSAWRSLPPWHPLFPLHALRTPEAILPFRSYLPFVPVLTHETDFTWVVGIHSSHTPLALNTNTDSKFLEEKSLEERARRMHDKKREEKKGRKCTVLPGKPVRPSGPLTPSLPFRSTHPKRSTFKKNKKREHY